MVKNNRADHYRKRAAEMHELARQAHTEEVRATYLNLAKNWDRLAEQLEQNTKSS